MYSVGPTLDQQCQYNSWLSCVRPILGRQRQNNCWSSCVVPTLGRQHHNNCWWRYVGPIICRQRQPSTNCTNQSPTLAQHMNAICLYINSLSPSLTPCLFINNWQRTGSLWHIRSRSTTMTLVETYFKIGRHLFVIIST